MADPTVKSVLEKYFGTSTPNLVKLKNNYGVIQDAFQDNTYQYECEEECDEPEAGYAWCHVGDIHLCMGILSTWDDHCIARLIIHEMAHRYGCLYDHGYCETSCYTASHPLHLYGCPLDEVDAEINADSYAGFAWACWMLKI